LLLGRALRRFEAADAEALVAETPFVVALIGWRPL